MSPKINTPDEAMRTLLIIIVVAVISWLAFNLGSCVGGKAFSSGQSSVKEQLLLHQ